MKKSLSLVLALLTLMLVLPASFGSVSAASLAPSDALGGYENLALTYTFNSSTSDNGKHTVDDLMPYVAYYDKNGNIADYFFDSYLFLPCVQNAPSGACYHRTDSRPTLASDWKAYIDDTFAAGYNVEALNTAFGNVKTKLNDDEKKAGVFFTILYPTKTATNFGNLDGVSLDFSKLSDRKTAVKWMIDEQLARYNAGGYDNLEVLGFYWLEEYLDNTSTQSDEYALLQYASAYLHSLGLKFIWIPYYKSNGYSLWKTFGFDAACMQPNLMWMNYYDADRVKNTIDLCAKYGMGMEMEIDDNTLYSADYLARYLSYLEGGMLYGAMDSLKMYYFGGKPGTYYYALRAGSAQGRLIYDLTWKYATGRLTQSDIDTARIQASDILPSGYDWISIGKPYIASTPYTVGEFVGYKDISGLELTDGKIANSDLGTEWHGFHKTRLDSDGRYSIVIDLESISGGISCLVAQFEDAQEYSIGLPGDMILYASYDNVNYVKVADGLTATDSSSFNIVTKKMIPFAARYIKLSFVNTDGNFVFCSEVFVGASDGYIRGDINGDGRFDTTDYILCKRICLGTYTAEGAMLMNADIDRSNGVNTIDYLMLKRSVLGTYSLD